MSTLLWKYFFENDVDQFRQTLARASVNAIPHTSKGTGPGRTSGNGLPGSPGNTLATSPTLIRSKKATGPRTPNSHVPGTSKSPANISRADLNWRDNHGVTLLHLIASSTDENASQLALALLQLPLLDIYAQDEESGWTALHRALYFGNITIARALMDRDFQDAIDHSVVGVNHGVGGLIKIKDREGYSPFDVYGASISNRVLRSVSNDLLLAGSQDDDENEAAQGVSGDLDDTERDGKAVVPRICINGDELFAFGSNKNLTLGLGDEDDRQFPERVSLVRPDHLLRRFYDEYKDAHPDMVPSTRTDNLPASVKFRPLIVQDVQLSKLHSAILTEDPEANLYVCGFGSGGRLGTGDETTRFSFTSIHGGGLAGKKVINVGLGQNHSIAITSDGETFTWGNNAFSQLGYASSPNNSSHKDEDPIQLLPRQVFGPLKREIVVGSAASRIHTVVHTSSSLYTFGKNEGQLGLVDSDARSLTVQNVPRKVGVSLFSSAIVSVSAIDKATTCLLEDNEVIVFVQYGYRRLSFPVEPFSNYFLETESKASRARSLGQPTRGHDIFKITSGGDTICAMTSMGDVFTFHVQKTDSLATSASTTNPSKIRDALSTANRIWSLKKGHMAVRDVDVGQDGSIIICTESGSVWRRVKRAKIKDTSATGSLDYKAKDYKFSRVPGLTRIAAVRSNTFGAYAAVRKDYDVLKTQVDVESKTLWRDLYPLLPFRDFGAEGSDTENPVPRFWTASQPNDVAMIRRAVITNTNLEEDLADMLTDQASSASSNFDLSVGTTLSDVRIPLHEFVFAGRSKIMRKAFKSFREAYFFTIAEVMSIEYDKEGRTLVLFQGVDFITVLNLALYMYTDSVVDIWRHTRHSPQSAFRYRQIRTELMKIASQLDMRRLEQAVRAMTEPLKTLHEDFEQAVRDPCYFENGDVEVELDGTSMKVHGALMCERCPFFEGLFQGRAAGHWLSTRRQQAQEPHDAIKVDLKHVNSDVFVFVLRYLYADIDEGLFDEVIATDLDTYLDLIMDVMSVANELMLDRLAQCCQKLLGQFVNTRNVCQLLNAVSPCSVTQFKDAALEYICLNLEGMLENHLLEELDSDLMLELDQVVRQNQLNRLPIAKSGRAEAELLDQYPQVIQIIERGKRIKVDQASLHSRLHDREAKGLGGSKDKAALLEEFVQSPTGQKSRRRLSKARLSPSTSPSLKARKSAADLMFEMEESDDSDEEKSSHPTSSRRQTEISQRKSSHSLPSGRQHDGSDDDGDSSEADESAMAVSASPSSFKTMVHDGTGNADSPQQGLDSSVNSRKAWAASSMTTPKMDLNNIMAQASSGRVSNLSSGLALREKQSGSSGTPVHGRLSQKERKKQQQQQSSQSLQQAPSASPTLDAKSSPSATPSSPWQVASRGPKISLKDVLGAESHPSPSTGIQPAARTPSPMTLRQTVSGKSAARRTDDGQARSIGPSQQQRSTSSPNITKDKTVPSPASRSVSTTTPPIQSIRHTSPSTLAEPTIQLSMADILYQQQTEKEIIKEAAAKRSLQEIQEEQAFQEWWDQESRKVREEEEVARRPVGRGGRVGRGKIRGGSGGRGKGRGGGEGGGNAGGEGGSSSGKRGGEGKRREGSGKGRETNEQRI